MIKFFHFLIFFVCMAWCVPAPCFADVYEEHLTDLKVNDQQRVILIYMDDEFARQSFTEKKIRKIYKKVTRDVHKALPREYSTYDVRIVVQGTPLENIIHHEQPSEEKKDKKKHERKHYGGWWDEVGYDGQPWVRNVSRPVTPTAALSGKHLSLWASHGRYYDVAQQRWKWQRPNLFCTTEDLFTQTIVVPYLMPMLENAGAIVFSPRERDWQTEEVIVDNDDAASGYSEQSQAGAWTTAAVKGFAMPQGEIYDNYNPFEQGTVRMLNTTREEGGKAVYRPVFRRSGRYAVYVSYATVDKSVDDALYTVWHQGIRTDFKVNQQIGGSTWVYLGSFYFDEGNPEQNRVELSSLSQHHGVVTTDAVRFGGGMGNIQRGGTVSGLPRCLEGARYYAQWAGLPYETLSLYSGNDDYKDDINVRSLMTNWVAGGSPYAPTKSGHGVPIDLSLAVHSDAGYNKDFTSIFGSLAVCTTDDNDGKLDAGADRSHSKDLARMLLEQSKHDLTNRYGDWRWRDLYDKNYSETRLPAVPSAIFETLSHQSFPDMRLAHDPDFKFTLARSIYKTLLHFEAEAHGEKAIVQPLSPQNFFVTLDTLGNATLVWMPQPDDDEPTAMPASYNVYTSVGVSGYDNGRNVKNTYFTQRLMPNILYRFRVTAVNEGGESFPTEELCAVWNGKQSPTILVINGFQRLAAPEVVNTDSLKGFDMDRDPGVSYGLTAGWCGRQQNFDITSAAFGVSSTEQEGHFVMGNEFNYVAEHADAISSAYKYNVVSSSRGAVEWGGVGQTLSRYDAIDLILGNERADGYSLRNYKTFTPALRKLLSDYAASATGSLTGRHALLVSGSYVGSDMTTDDERQFLSSLLHCSGIGSVTGANSYIQGLGRYFPLTTTLNDTHYASTRSDILAPTDAAAFVSMTYNDNQAAAVACPGPVATYVMGFPFECITSASQRAFAMRGILQFLIP